MAVADQRPRLDRARALSAVIGDGSDFAIVTGLGSSVFDVARLTADAPTVFPLDGVMGAAVSMGLGLALFRPDLNVLVVTGDGELLMNVGALCTVAVHDPANLSIVCVDNGRYGLTGGQLTHTAISSDIAAIAAGAGIRRTMDCRAEPDLAGAADLVRSRDHASVVVLKVDDQPSAPLPVDRDGVSCRLRFAAAIASSATRGGAAS